MKKQQVSLFLNVLFQLDLMHDTMKGINQLNCVIINLNRKHFYQDV